jgi:hypothetical protein
MYRHLRAMNPWENGDGSFEVFAAFWMLCMDSLATAAFGRIAVRTDEPNKLRSPNA